MKVNLCSLDGTPASKKMNPAKRILRNTTLNAMGRLRFLGTRGSKVKNMPNGLVFCPQSFTSETNQIDAFRTRVRHVAEVALAVSLKLLMSSQLTGHLHPCND